MANEYGVESVAWARVAAWGFLLAALADAGAQTITAWLPENRAAVRGWDRFHMTAIAAVGRPALLILLAIAVLGLASPASRRLLGWARALAFLLFGVGVVGLIQALVLPADAPRYLGGDNRLVEALHLLPGVVLAGTASGAARRLRPRSAPAVLTRQPAPAGGPPAS